MMQNYKKYRSVYHETCFEKSVNTKEVIMKYIFILATILLVMSACTTQYQAGNYDDVYYSPKSQPPAPKHQMVVKTPEADANAYSQGESQQAQQAPAPIYYDQDTIFYADDQPYVTENDPNADYGYNSDDYYDYAYAARIRRFYNPYSYNSYYNDYYTNSYWYDPDPWNWGLSIYMGYNFWGGGFSYGYNPWYMDPYYGWGYSGYYGYGYPYYGYPYYGYGYYNDCYYNSYDHNSSYYGHRGSVGVSGSTARTDNKTFGERYEARLGRSSSTINDSRASGISGNERGGTSSSAARGSSEIEDSRGGLTRGSAITQDARSGSAGTTTTPNARPQSGTGTTANPAYRPGSTAQRPGTTTQRPGTTTQRPGTTTQRPGTTTQRPANSNTTQPQRQYQYVSPNRSNQNAGNTSRENVNNGRNTQSYTSPEYNRPRSGQEYTSPKYRNTQPSGNEQNKARVSPPSNSSTPRSGNVTQPNNTRPNTRSNESYQAPRNNSNSQPARSNTYSAPPRSSSPSPNRSSESYTPSRSSSSSSGSGGSYTPSRSSSSGSSGSSSSGSGGNSSSGSGRSSSSGSGGRK